jgi:hypothetical protein
MNFKNKNISRRCLEYSEAEDLDDGSGKDRDTNHNGFGKIVNNCHFDTPIVRGQFT